MGPKFGHIVTQATRDKVSRTKKSRNLRGEMSHMYGKHLMPLTKQLLRVQRLGKHTRPASEASKRRVSESVKLAWQNPKIRERQSKAIAEAFRLRGPHPSKGIKRTPEFCEKIKQAKLKQWQSPEFRAKMVTAWLNMRSPNNMELQLLSILDKHYPGEWEFVGNGKVILSGLNPDFINVNGKKQIIEFFGEYWHTPQNPGYRFLASERFRIKEFAKLGFKTLVIWDKELKDEVAIVSKIDKFART